MELTPKQQTVELIRTARRIVVFSHQHPDGDAVASMLALTLALRKLGKTVTPACSDPVPQYLQFLPATDQVVREFDVASEFVISVDTKSVEIDKLGYKNQPEQQKLNIVIKPSRGTITPEMVSFSGGNPTADLLIVLDTNDVERLGAIYDQYTSLFYETPIINIDHHPGNDYFGKVNWVDLTATSTAEILVSLIESLSSLNTRPGAAVATPANKPAAPVAPKTLLDADIATLLLAGITTDTGSFQNSNTTPKSFTVAAQLVAAGARQQEIVQHIYKTKPLSTLKLWGKILGNIQEDEAGRFIWSTVHQADFSTFGAAEAETSGVIDELLKTAPGIDFALLLSEKSDGLYASLRGVTKSVSVADIAGLFGGGGHDMAAAFRIAGGSLPENESEIIEKIRQFQVTRLQGASTAPNAAPTNAAPAAPFIPSVASLKERQAQFVDQPGPINPPASPQPAPAVQPGKIG